MGRPACIAGDWGTSRLRIALCDAAGNCLDERPGLGAAAAKGHFAEILTELTAPWIAQHAPIQILLTGMVGSNFGWVETPYLSCPARLDTIASALVFTSMPAGAPVAITPGLACLNGAGAPDIMRGEETQILGAMELCVRLRSGEHVLCLPGTHTKWALLRDGAIVTFHTAMSGELFEIVRKHSVLIAPGDGTASASHPAFERALAQADRHSPLGLAQLMFEARSRTLRGDIEASAGASFLSGTIIGCDVAGAAALYETAIERTAEIVLVGAKTIAEPYARAIERRGLKSLWIDGTSASFSGLCALWALNAARASHDA